MLAILGHDVVSLLTLGLRDGACVRMDTLPSGVMTVWGIQLFVFLRFMHSMVDFRCGSVIRFIFFVCSLFLFDGDQRVS